MEFKPLADRILVKPLESEEKTKGGIVLPETAQEKPQEGEVLAVGKDVKEVKKGDKVLFTKYSPTEIKIDDEELYVLKEEDILGIIS